MVLLETEGWQHPLTGLEKLTGVRLSQSGIRCRRTPVPPASFMRTPGATKTLDNSPQLNTNVQLPGVLERIQSPSYSGKPCHACWHSNRLPLLHPLSMTEFGLLFCKQ